jgi:hypothetical protein
MEALVQWSKDTGEKIDLIIWTGDSVSHQIHRISQEHTFESLVQLSTLLK